MKKYQCIGENFSKNSKMGLCGDIHTLDKWIEVLYPDKIDFVKDYFSDMTEKEILEYIFNHMGKRLKVFKL